MNQYSRLGDGSNTNRSLPVEIQVGTKWKQVAAGETQSLGIKEDGTLYIWGENPIKLNCLSGMDVIASGRAARYDFDRDEYRLTRNFSNSSGAVWSASEIDLNKNFTIKAEIYLGDKDGGADGMALVFQHKDNHLVGKGGYLGYKDVSPSLIVEFDTYQNNVKGEMFNDPAEDHVGILINGSPIHNLAAKDYVTVNNLEDGEYHPIQFTWHAENQTFDLILDGEPIFTNRQFPSDVLTGPNDRKVDWGFTAATG